MANWIVFTSTAPKPVSLSINLDLVKNISPGSAANTISLDGVLVRGDVATLMLMLNCNHYPGAVQGSPITTS